MTFDLKVDFSKEVREALLLARLKEAKRLLKRALVAFPRAPLCKEIVAFLAKEKTR